MTFRFALVAAAAALSLPAVAQETMQHDHGEAHDTSAMHDHGDQAAPAAAAEVTDASATAKVKGMVCDFCARAVEKVFGREDAVEAVSVDLDEGAIRIAFKPGQSLSDERIGELVKKSGYALTAIERAGA